MLRKRVVASLFTAFSLAILSNSPVAAAAETYPDKTITIVVPFAPGGGSDITARTIGQYLSEAVSQPVVVENRSGADTQIATSYVINSKPDGYRCCWAQRP